ncbi:putative ribonuclease H-like domain-containing protein [Tanacetum coccineum]|uniref:Ribonuclease H-like domain-containing protein n=1 Tax=Tanacetum coccineum TaxID=301880 RepID=A0ABQ4WI57_9ASTR
MGGEALKDSDGFVTMVVGDCSIWEDVHMCVPPPLSEDYTPQPQEDIDDSFYVYGKKGPQKPEISVQMEFFLSILPVKYNGQTSSEEHGNSEVTNSAGTPTSIASEEKDEEVEIIVVPSAVKIPEEKDESRTTSKNSKPEETLTEPQTEMKDSSTNPKIQAFRRELEEIALKHLGNVPENNTTSTHSINTGSHTVNTGRLDHDDSLMPELEIFHKPETGIFDEASYDDEGVITDFNSLPTEIEVSPTPTLRIHSIHPKSQILGDPKSAVQTRSKVQNKSGAHALLSHTQKQQRNNHKDQQHCLFACFLSQEEPKKIAEALQDDSWVQAMQEELLQFKLQQVWVLVDLPHGMKVIGTKWVYRNKRDERGVVVRINGGLVAQGVQAGSGIDYDEFLLLWQDGKLSVTPKTLHLNVMKRIFKYLKGKPNLGLWYPRESTFDLEAFSDSDYGGSNLDRKSTAGGCQFLGQRLILWQCKKQTIVNPVYHSKIKHIEIRHHFIRYCYEKKLIRVEKIHTDLNVADLLTKPFDGPRFNFLVVSIGMINLASFKGRNSMDLQMQGRCEKVFVLTRCSICPPPHPSSTVVQPSPPITQLIPLIATTIPPLSQPAPPTPIAETTTASPSLSPSPTHEPMEPTFEQPSTD